MDENRKPPKNPENPPRMVRIFDRAHIKAGQAFRTSDSHAFGVGEDGAFIRLDKDRRSVKERKRARREARSK